MLIENAEITRIKKICRIYNKQECKGCAYWAAKCKLEGEPHQWEAWIKDELKELVKICNSKIYTQYFREGKTYKKEEIDLMKRDEYKNIGRKRECEKCKYHEFKTCMFSENKPKEYSVNDSYLIVLEKYEVGGAERLQNYGGNIENQTYAVVSIDGKNCSLVITNTLYSFRNVSISATYNECIEELLKYAGREGVYKISEEYRELK